MTEPHPNAPKLLAAQTGVEQAQVQTEYVVLGAYEDVWTVAARVTCRDTATAVRTVAAAKDDLPARIRGTDVFVAVPTRSWKPVKVTAKVETTLVLEEA